MKAATSETWPEDWPSYETILAISRGVVSCDVQAESLAHDAVTRGLEVVRRTGSKLKSGWFRTVIINLKRDRFRRDWQSPVHSRGGTFELDQLDQLDGRDLAPANEERIVRDAVEAMLGQIERLPEASRDVLRLKFFEGASTSDIAAHLDVAPRTVDRRLRGAMEMLAARLRSKDGRLHSGVIALASLGNPPGAASTGPEAATATVGTKYGLFVAALAAIAAVPLAVMLRGALAAPDIEGTDVGRIDEPELVEQELVSEDSGSEELSRSEVELPLETSAETAPTNAAEAEVETIAAPPSRDFTIRLNVNGEPAAGWSVFPPFFEPDVFGVWDEDVLKASVHEESDVPGEYRFVLPDVAGTWQFLLHNSSSPAVRFVIEARDQEVFEASFDLAPFEFELDVSGEDPADVEAMVGLLGNPSPGVWVSCQAFPVDGSPSTWRCKSVLVGKNEVAISAPAAFDPALWKRMDGVSFSVPAVPKGR